MTFAAAVALAAQRNPRVKLAEDDLARSRALLEATKDAYIPAVTANGGAGNSYGITLSVPTIFTINAQSLIYSASQRSYLHGSQLSYHASTLSLEDAREHAAEDAATTYIDLDHLQQAHAVQEEICRRTLNLQAIVQKRFAAGFESELALDEAERNAVGARLQLLQMEDGTAYLAEHLNVLIGGAAGIILATVHDSIPDLTAALAVVADDSIEDSPGLRSAEANARAKQLQANGDTRYTWRPQIAFASQYGRISPINDVTAYYNLHGNYNTFFFGLSIALPLVDTVHKARARESLADAAHANHEVLLLRSQQQEEAMRVRHGVEEFKAKARIAELDEKIAQSRLKSVLTETRSGGDGGPVLNPKDEENAYLLERQRYLDLLDAHAQLQKAQVALLRTSGALGSWLYPGVVTRAVRPTQP